MDRHSQKDALSSQHDGSGRIKKPESASDRMAAIKARVAAVVGTSKSKGGLNVALHPDLENLGSWKSSNSRRDSYAKPKPQTGQWPRGDDNKGTQAGAEYTANSREGRINPYYDNGAASQTSGKRREPRQLLFNQKGKYIQQANALRRQAALEAMKKRIAEQTRKTGIDEDLDVERNFTIEAPPSIEWWDEGLVLGESYSNIDQEDKLNLTTPDSIITEYIQHPVAVEPPQDRLAPSPKPMFLTSKEQAKLRRQRRMAELKEMQAKIRLGLVPAPPPKVKKGNLMRVLGDGTCLNNMTDECVGND